MYCPAAVQICLFSYKCTGKEQVRFRALMGKGCWEVIELVWLKRNDYCANKHTAEGLCEWANRAMKGVIPGSHSGLALAVVTVAGSKTSVWRNETLLDCHELHQHVSLKSPEAHALVKHAKYWGTSQPSKQAHAGGRARSLGRCLQSSKVQFVTAATSINGKVGRLL